MSVSIWNKEEQSLTEIAGKPAELVPTISWTSRSTLSGSSYTLTKDVYYTYEVVSTSGYPLYVNGGQASSSDTSSSVTVSTASGFAKKGDVFTQSSSLLNHVVVYPVVWTRATNPSDVITVESHDVTASFAVWSDNSITYADVAITLNNDATGKSVFLQVENSSSQVIGNCVKSVSGTTLNARFLSGNPSATSHSFTVKVMLVSL